jgi:prepilin-type N-terminal cleavage/methylation domain-containing protein
MLRFLQRARRKEGFTLVELVVVIGIIAIMTSVAVPNAIAYQRRADAREQNDHASGFYLALQQTLLSTMEHDNTPREFSWNGVSRISGLNPIVTTSTSSFFLYLERTNGVNTARMTFTANTGAGLPNVAAFGEADEHGMSATSPPAPEVNKEVFDNLMSELNSYMRQSADGYYYALFDHAFRVTVVYFSRFEARPAAGGVHSTNRSNRLPSGRTFGAYPNFYAFEGAYNCRPGMTPVCNGHNRPAGSAWFDTDRVCIANMGSVSLR